MAYHFLYRDGRVWLLLLFYNFSVDEGENDKKPEKQDGLKCLSFYWKLFEYVSDDLDNEFAKLELRSGNYYAMV